MVAGRSSDFLHFTKPSRQLLDSGKEFCKASIPNNIEEGHSSGNCTGFPPDSLLILYKTILYLEP